MADAVLIDEFQNVGMLVLDTGSVPAMATSMPAAVTAIGSKLVSAACVVDVVPYVVDVDVIVVLWCVLTVRLLEGAAVGMSLASGGRLKSAS